MIQYFVSSLGRDAASCADLMSYLLFTSKYTRELIDIGYHDAGKRIDEIEDFLYSSQEGDADDPVASGAARMNSGAKRNGNSARSRA
jgi:NTE family protein